MDTLQLLRLVKREEAILQSEEIKANQPLTHHRWDTKQDKVSHVLYVLCCSMLNKALVELEGHPTVK